MKVSKEEAKKILKEHPEPNWFLRPLFEAIANETLNDFYLNKFISKKNDYSDDLPKVDVRTLETTQGERSIVYKCQGNYVVGLCLDLQAVIDHELITSPTLIKKIRQFIRSDLNFKVGDRKNKNRIRRINKILKQVIKSLRRK